MQPSPPAPLVLHGSGACIALLCRVRMWKAGSLQFFSQSLTGRHAVIQMLASWRVEIHVLDKSWHTQYGCQQTCNVYRRCSWYQLLLMTECHLTENSEDLQLLVSANAAIQLQYLWWSRQLNLDPNKMAASPEYALLFCQLSFQINWDKQ